MAIHDRHDIHYIHYIHDIHDIHYIHYIHYIRYRQYIQYIHDIQTYSTYITDITYTLHDFTAHPDLWQLRAWEGEGDRGEKKQSFAHSCCQRSLTPIQAHALPSACRAESCLLVASLSHPLSRYLPDYLELLHDSLADCKLKGDELST